MNKIRILLDASEITDKRNGAAQYVINLIKAFNAWASDRISLLLILNPFITIDFFLTYFDTLSIEYIFLKTRTNSIGPKRDLSFLIIESEVKEKYDLFICPSEKWPYFMKHGIMVLHDARSIDSTFKGLNFLKRYYLKKILKKGIQRCDKIICVSRTTRDLFESLLRNKKIGTKAIVNFPLTDIKINYEDHALSRKVKECLSLEYFFYYGQLWRPHKNIEKIRAAFQAYRKRYKNNTFFVFAGDDKNQYSWQRDENEIYVGYINEDEKSALLQHMRALCHLSLYEGFGYPLIEAFQLNKIVLCSDIPVFKELYGSKTFYANPQDVQDMARGLHTIIESKGRSLELQLNKFDNKALFTNILWLIEQLYVNRCSD